MLDLEVLKSVQYLVDKDGRKSAIQVDLRAWEMLLGYLEDLEDRASLRDKLQRLERGPEISGAISWDEAQDEW